MKKKIVLAATCIMLGVIMLVTTAFAGAAADSGYEAYKDALKKSFETHSFSAKMAASIKDNGNALAELSGDMKVNSETMSGTNTMKIKNQEKVMKIYGQENKTIIKGSDSDTYYVINGGKNDGNCNQKCAPAEQCNPEANKAKEAVVDALVGNLKNYIACSEKADGSKDISFELSGTQIPSVVNALISAGIKEGAKKDYKGFKSQSPFNNDLKFEDIGLPKLVDNIRISDVGFNALINKEGVLESQAINIAVLGNDVQGKEHKVLFSMDMNFSGFGDTTPDKVDLTGKQVKTIDPKEFPGEHNRD